MSERRRGAAAVALDLSTASTDRAPASWIIVERSTGRAVFETYDRQKVEALNAYRYEALPVLQYLAGLNRR